MLQVLYSKQDFLLSNIGMNREVLFSKLNKKCTSHIFNSMCIILTTFDDLYSFRDIIGSMPSFVELEIDLDNYLVFKCSILFFSVEYLTEFVFLVPKFNQELVEYMKHLNKVTDNLG